MQRPPARLELRPPKGFAAPLHAHRNEDEFFLVLSGHIRLQHGDTSLEAAPGSFAYTPRGVGHSLHVDSDDARLLLFFGPAGVGVGRTARDAVTDIATRLDIAA